MPAELSVVITSYLHPFVVGGVAATACWVEAEEWEGWEVGSGTGRRTHRGLTVGEGS